MKHNCEVAATLLKAIVAFFLEGTNTFFFFGFKKSNVC